MMRHFERYTLLVLIHVFFFGFTGIATAGGKRPSGGPSVDRLAWLSGLIEQLKHSEAPSCVGPRGCKADIPADSPCARPSSEQPDVIVDGVLPGDATGAWVVAYRLMCSECYLGGTAHLALVRVGKAKPPQIVETTALKRDEADEIPEAVEMKSVDVDADDRLEIVVRYNTVRERTRKCTGLRDASSYFLVVRTEKGRIIRLLSERSAYHPVGKGRPYTEAVRFLDESEDGYPDWVSVRTTLPNAACEKKGAKCKREGELGIHTTVTVKRYVEDAGDWSAPAFNGHALASGDGIQCEVPLPEKPFVVVAETLPGKKLTAAMEQKADALRSAGFERTCLYDGEDFKGLLPKHFYVIVSAHTSRSEADDRARRLRAAGFRPFVKELFK